MTEIPQSIPTATIGWKEKAETLIRPLDRLLNYIYGAAWNPLYQSGTLAMGLILVMVVTGIYLLIFYETGDPWQSVAWLQDQAWHGRWIRSLHRYSSTAAMVAVVVHIVRVFLQGRTWGPRALAWFTGLIMLGIMLLCGWTGLIMVWDIQGHLIAEQGARLLDVLPIFSEPIRRSFITDSNLSSGFFFLNLVLHIALPLGILLFLWVHTMRIARPNILPPRRMFAGLVLVLMALSLVIPVSLPPRANVLVIPGEVPIDLTFGFWLPLFQWFSPPVVLAGWAALTGFLVSVPWWWRPRKEQIQSIVQEPFCTGCTQCYQDCPYEAIQMVPREVGQGSELVGRVDPNRCVGCGICAGSCAPMRVGPAPMTGLAQLEQARLFQGGHTPVADEIVVMACQESIGGSSALGGVKGVHLRPVTCAGSIHSSIVEFHLKSGAGGVYILSCHSRNCLYREGPKWLHERLYNDREAELQPRVDRRRLRVGHFGGLETSAAIRDIQAFQTEIRKMQSEIPAGEAYDPDLDCEIPEAGNG